MRGFLWIFALFCALLFCACSGAKSHYARLSLPQDIKILPAIKKSYALNDRAYKKKFFAPWHFKGKRLDERTAFWAFEGYLRGDYYFFNKQKIPLNFFKKAVANANSHALLSLKQKAIITQNTLLKNLPTQTAILKEPFKEGEGVPFDYALDSALNFGSPVLISHFTQDKRFAFVLSEAGWGFVEALHLQSLTDSQASHYESLNFITPLRERLAVQNERGEFVFEARVGGIYAYSEFKNGLFYGQAGSKTYQIHAANAEPFPLAWNENNVKALIKELLGRPYGWGGYDFERDCSALIRDFYAAFGVYLPRNSLAQSANFGEKFDISGLNNAQKKAFIARHGKPYETLLYLKGHIMLFVGVVGKENTAFHAIWGVKTKDDGRLIVGKSVLSALDIGKDSSEVGQGDLILTRLETMSIINLNDSEKQRIHRALRGF